MPSIWPEKLNRINCALRWKNRLLRLLFPAEFFCKIRQVYHRNSVHFGSNCNPMKKAVLIFAISLLWLNMSQCGQSTPKGPDQSTPQGTMKIIFAAAQTGDFESLRGLCDPSGKGDGDTKRYICGAANAPEEFVKYFAKAQLDGSPKIEGDRAAVPFLFGPDGHKKETMNMVKRDGKWYLSSF